MDARAPRPKLDADATFHPVAVFGTDERRDLAADEVALTNAIGILSLGQSSYCSAFCVGDDVIATASHCLLGTEETESPDLTRVVFRVGGDSVGSGARSTTLLGRSSDRIRRLIRAGTNRLRLSKPIAAASDWALVHLSKPVCTAAALPLSTLPRRDLERAVETRKIKLYQVAMHRDVSADRLAISGPCTIERSFAQADEASITHDFEDAAAIIMHTCDTGPGSSGSPLLIDTPEGPHVVGINVGTYVLARNAATSASDAAAPASEAIANTALDVSRFKSALETFSIVTGTIKWRRAIGEGTGH